MEPRCYKFTKKITTDQVKKFEKEMAELENVEFITISEDNKYMTVKTKDDEYGPVMKKAINICRRVANECEMEFDHFVYED